jgi:hypothetical protein
MYKKTNTHESYNMTRVPKRYNVFGVPKTKQSQIARGRSHVVKPHSERPNELRMVVNIYHEILGRFANSMDDTAVKKGCAGGLNA